MKIQDFRLQNGKVVYKWGISFIKQESHLQSGTLGVQTGLSACHLPRYKKQQERGCRIMWQIFRLKSFDIR